MSTRKLTGIPLSPGIAIGHAYVLDRRTLKTPKRHILDNEVGIELARFDAAIVASDDQLERVKKKLREKEGDDHFQILEAHQLILHDEHLVEPTRRAIREEKVNAEWALRRTVEEIKTLFNAIEEDYFRERRSDVDFVGDRILRNLLGVQVDLLTAAPTHAIFVAHDLSPADTAQLHRVSCAALVTDVGGKTSHTAILARAFRIPAVAGLAKASETIVSGELLIVDGIRGEVLVSPSAEEVAAYRARARRHTELNIELLGSRDIPAETSDGRRVKLFANVEVTEEVPAALEHGAEGIGLYRTEFLYLERSDLPREEEHFMHARGVLRRVAPFPVTFRTLDLGGDKRGPLGPSLEANPALGLRSIRLCLKEPAMFKTQLRGLLRASAHGRMRLMFPMISGLAELRAAKAILEEARSELRREGHAFDEHLPVGIMVEMPAAAMTTDHLAKECDFLSIGTNDLIQYSLAIDRVNEHVSYLYHPLHPAILRFVKYIVDAGHAAGVRVGMCGEMAGDPMFTQVLLGLGLDELSMNPSSIPVVKSVVRESTQIESGKLLDEVMGLGSTEDIEHLVRERMSNRFPGELFRANHDD